MNLAKIHHHRKENARDQTEDSIPNPAERLGRTKNLFMIPNPHQVGIFLVTERGQIKERVKRPAPSQVVFLLRSTRRRTQIRRGRGGEETREPWASPRRMSRPPSPPPSALPASWWRILPAGAARATRLRWCRRSSRGSGCWSGTGWWTPRWRRTWRRSTPSPSRRRSPLLRRSPSRSRPPIRRPRLK